MLLRTGFFVAGLCCALPVYADVPPEANMPQVPDTSAPAADIAAMPAPALAPESSASPSAPPANVVPGSTPPAISAEVVPAPEAAAKSSDYILPTWPDLLHTMVRFNALDLEDNNLVDEYAAVTDCDIYELFSKDDFKWNTIRQRVRESANMNLNKYPVHYYFYAILQLDHYDWVCDLRGGTVGFSFFVA